MMKFKVIYQHFSRMGSSDPFTNFDVIEKTQLFECSHVTQIHNFILEFVKKEFDSHSFRMVSIQRIDKKTKTNYLKSILPYVDQFSILSQCLFGIEFLIKVNEIESNWIKTEKQAMINKLYLRCPKGEGVKHVSCDLTYFKDAPMAFLTTDTGEICGREVYNAIHNFNININNDELKIFKLLNEDYLTIEEYKTLKEHKEKGGFNVNEEPLKSLDKQFFDECRDAFDTRLVYLYGESSFEDKSMFDVNEVMGYVIEDVFNNNGDPYLCLREMWGFTCWLAERIPSEG